MYEVTVVTEAWETKKKLQRKETFVLLPYNDERREIKFLKNVQVFILQMM